MHPEIANTDKVNKPRKIKNQLNKLGRSLTNCRDFIDYLDPFNQSLGIPAARGDMSPAKVTQIRRISDNLYTISLKPRFSRTLDFRAGQFIQLEAEMNGRRVRRCFSISNCPSEHQRSGVLELTIGVQKQGIVTPWLSSNSAIGKTIYFSKAHGDFTLKNTRNNYTFIAAGSGLSPILSMIRELSETRALSGKALLFYGKSCKLEQGLLDEFARLRQEGLNIKILDPAIDGYFTESHIPNHAIALRSSTFYICGPTSLMEAANVELANAGVDISRIQTERFTTTTSKASSDNSEANEVVVSLSMSSLPNKSSHYKSNNQVSLLDSLEAEGFKVHSGCRIGVCHQCVCKKSSGRVFNKLTGLTSDSGAEDIQLCQSVPLEDVSIEL